MNAIRVSLKIQGCLQSKTAGFSSGGLISFLFEFSACPAHQNRNAPPLLIEGAFVHRWWNPKRSKP
ncbi:hypothetical protein ELH27_03030 [Rhizobium leguminosarum]|uniref:Uncharacterized protein n=1 Tax=Rhizobium beringeri TaxID=3019934 RepID=A0ABY1XQJ8_9HYPH|nr:hypothetical protein ELH27_03030 [Rhizobium leguminosarum]TBD03435.1 hypothetical protein ELH21_02975 [Rhizobium leguminosarum]TBE69795.1 hypothetical protein ELH03_02910 [Rhizobium beringeri]